MSKKIIIIMSVILTLTLVLNISSFTANAEKVEEVVTQTTANSKSVNISKISTNFVNLGYSVTLNAAARGLDEKKCQYAFYYKYEDEGWTTLQKYDHNDTVQWTPEQMGIYEICIKIFHSGKVYKKYFDLIAAEELVNVSLVSSSHIKTGDTVNLTAKARGGMPSYQYAYYCKNVSSDSWITLNDFKQADSMQWKPQEKGEYEICIKAKDVFGQVSEKYFELTVENEGIKTPAEFSLKLKAPISAPYQWSYEISDENVLKFKEKMESSNMSVSGAYVDLDYRFRTAKAGVSDITMKYTAYNGKVYSITYTVTVDKHLNYTVNKTEGNYFEKELPELQRITTGFSVDIQNAPMRYKWKFDISNTNVVELSGVDKGDTETYKFTALRKGFASIILSCVSYSDTNTLYQLVYDIEVDDDFNVTVKNYDGYYFENYWLPEIRF